LGSRERRSESRGGTGDMPADGMSDCTSRCSPRAKDCACCDMPSRLHADSAACLIKCGMHVLAVLAPSSQTLRGSPRLASDPEKLPDWSLGPAPSRAILSSASPCWHGLWGLKAEAWRLYCRSRAQRSPPTDQTMRTIKFAIAVLGLRSLPARPVRRAPRTMSFSL
jgi:hypothetical protein